jgi:xylulokinase
MLLLGLDIGSSFIKASVYDVDKQKEVISVTTPEKEIPIVSIKKEFAEQDPELWWTHVKNAIHLIRKAGVNMQNIYAIGISYQMHGLVTINKEGILSSPAIIWCDSRAVELGEGAYQSLGEEYCLSNLLNSPGNFTASKLKWVKEYKKEVYGDIKNLMLPGDYISYKLTGEISTTIQGLSEGVFWNFEEQCVDQKLLNYYGIDENLIPEANQSFAIHGTIEKNIAEELNINPTAVVSYKAGDQPNNAFSLNVVNPGELAATAGTSGVVYAVSEDLVSDSSQRVNSFAHVNHQLEYNSIGVLLCINGTGSAYAWLRSLLGKQYSYTDLNQMIDQAILSPELMFYPFGNGAERILNNQNPGAALLGINFNMHSQGQIARSIMEGVIFSLFYGIEVLDEIGIKRNVIRAGNANMFQSNFFTQELANLSQTPIELYNTSGALGAAIGAGLGAKIFNSQKEAFAGLRPNREIHVNENKALSEKYLSWKTYIETKL